MPSHPSPIMAVLPYTPRDDSASRGYDQWLRDVDTPFFNSIPGVVHYSNWKLRDTIKGPVDFTYISYLFLDPEKHAEVWANPELIEFAADWTRLWGRDPDNADLSVNYHCYLMRCEETLRPFDGTGMTLAIEPATGIVIGGNRWQIIEAMVGINPVSGYEIAFGTPPAGLPDADARAIATFDLVAAP